MDSHHTLERRNVTSHRILHHYFLIETPGASNVYVERCALSIGMVMSCSPIFEVLVMMLSFQKCFTSKI